MALTLTRTVLKTCLVAWLAMTLLFFALRLLPGDIVTAQLGGIGISQAAQEERRQQLGLNEPLLIQYMEYFAGWVRGEWGDALSSGESVLHAVSRSINITMQITLFSMLFATFLGAGWAFIINCTGWQLLRDVLRLILDILLAIPIYWSATLFLFIFAVPITTSFQSGLIAVLLLGLHVGASIAQLIAQIVQQQARAPYVQTAFGKGLKKHYIYWRHIMPNVSLITLPFVTAQFSLLLSGTVIIESILVLPGMGTLLLNATLNRDYVLLQGAITVIIVLISVVSGLSHMALYTLNPRLRSHL